MKNRDFGVCDFIECSYNPANRRIFQTSTGDRLVYGWDHSGIEEPEQKACELPDFRIQEGEPRTGLGL